MTRTEATAVAANGSLGMINSSCVGERLLAWHVKQEPPWSLPRGDRIA